jgi:hypothetical protein
MPFGPTPGHEDDEEPFGTDGRPNGKANDQAQGGQQSQQPTDPFEPIDFPSLAGKTPPERRFVIEGWVPAGCVTSLYGQGGIGKSMLAQQMATCVATGVSAFGFRVAGPAPVVGIFTEDDNDELWRRQQRINAAIGWRMEQLGKLHLQGRARLDNTLVSYPSSQKPQTHPLLQLIAEVCERYRPGLLILDNIAQLFGGDENNRFEVSHFCNVATSLARAYGCGVLLLGHPFKADGSEYSGSTAWNAAVRSRLLLGRDKEGELRLMRPKANYAQNDDLALFWADSVLIPTTGNGLGPAGEAARQQRERHAEEVFLAGLDQLTGLKVWVSYSANASNYAPKMIRQYGKNQGLKPEVLRDAMLRLIERAVILTDQPLAKKADRKWSKGLVRASDAGIGQGQEEDRPEPDRDGAAAPAADRKQAVASALSKELCDA